MSPPTLKKYNFKIQTLPERQIPFVFLIQEASPGHGASRRGTCGESIVSFVCVTCSLWCAAFVRHVGKVLKITVTTDCCRCVRRVVDTDVGMWPWMRARRGGALMETWGRESALVRGRRGHRRLHGNNRKGERGRRRKGTGARSWGHGARCWSDVRTGYWRRGVVKKRGPRSPPREEARWYYPARLAAPGPVQMAFSGSAGGEQRMFKAGRQGERGMGAAATPGIKGGLGVDPGSDPHRRRFATERPSLKATAAGQRRHHGKWGKSRARGATPDLARVVPALRPPQHGRPGLSARCILP